MQNTNAIWRVRFLAKFSLQFYEPFTHAPFWEQSLIQSSLTTLSTRWRGSDVFFCASSRHCSFIASRAESAQEELPLIWKDKRQSIQWARWTSADRSQHWPFSARNVNFLGVAYEMFLQNKIKNISFVARLKKKLAADTVQLVPRLRSLNAEVIT